MKVITEYTFNPHENGVSLSLPEHSKIIGVNVVRVPGYEPILCLFIEQSTISPFEEYRVHVRNSYEQYEENETCIGSYEDAGVFRHVTVIYPSHE